jgi:hypothetical protein
MLEAWRGKNNKRRRNSFKTALLPGWDDGGRAAK